MEEKIIELFEHDWFSLFIDKLNMFVSGYKKWLYAVNPDSNVVKYTDHDLNRIMIQILIAMKKAPIEVMKARQLEVIQSEQGASDKIQWMIEKLEKHIGQDEIE